jgi:hypothetical protein
LLRHASEAYADGFEAPEVFSDSSTPSRTSVDDWAACGACHELILAGDRHGLVLLVA